MQDLEYIAIYTLGHRYQDLENISINTLVHRHQDLVYIAKYIGTQVTGLTVKAIDTFIHRS